MWKKSFAIFAAIVGTVSPKFLQTNSDEDDAWKSI